MIDIKGVSLGALTVGIRWARMNNFPINLAEWSKDENLALQRICKEIDRRRKERRRI